MAEEAGGDTAKGVKRRAVLGAAVGGGSAGMAGGIGGTLWVRNRLGDVTRAQAEARAAAGPDDLAARGVLPIIWSVPVTSPTLAFTFDDGPDPDLTPGVLEVLSRYGVKATFNVMGWNCTHHRDVLAAVVAAGHEIGNHSWSHVDQGLSDPAEVRAEIGRATTVIAELAKVSPRFFRPPRGSITGATLVAAAEHHQQVLLWSLAGGLPGVRSSNEIRRHVVSRLAAGLIVDFHDGIGRSTFDRTSDEGRRLLERRQRELAALPSIIEAALARGLRLVTVSGLLAEPRRDVGA